MTMMNASLGDGAYAWQPVSRLVYLVARLAGVLVVLLVLPVNGQDERQELRQSGRLSQRGLRVLELC